MRRLLTLLTVTVLLLSLVVPIPAHAFHGVRMTYAAAGSSGITVADNDNIFGIPGTGQAFFGAFITAASQNFGTGNFTLRWKGALPDWSPESLYSLFYNGQRNLLGVGQ